MTTHSLNAVGPVLAAELGLSVRNEAARRHDDSRTVTVEVVRAVDPQSRLKAGTDAMRSVPAAQRMLIDISV